MQMQKLKKRSIRLEFSAGGIVFRYAKKDPEIAFILDPFNKWAFAKGHIEKGEGVEAAAVREVSEEMGVPQKYLKIIAPLGKIDWWFRERRSGKTSPKGSLIHKFVYYFLMRAPADVRFRPQYKELIRQVKWVPIDKAMELSSYKDIRPALQKAIQYLER